MTWKIGLASVSAVFCALFGICACSAPAGTEDTTKPEPDSGVVLTGEVCGAWHRPNVTGSETTLQGLCDTLDTFSNAGVNLIFAETFYHGMTTYRSRMIPYYTALEAYDYAPYPDYLTALVAEAAERGIQVHAWVEDFYIGISSSAYLVKEYPEWLLLNQSGSYLQKEGSGYIFLDPANAEVRQFLVDLYDEMLSAVPGLAGINLDYIRYPLSDRQSDTGFTVAAMTEFSEKVGSPLTKSDRLREEFLALLDRNSLYDQWVDYRADCVTRTVREICMNVREKHFGKVISSAVFPDVKTTYATKKQNFEEWIRYGYLDIVTPMAYYDGIAALEVALSEMLELCDDLVCYAGLSATYHSLPVESVLAQIGACERLGMDGVIFFGSQSLLGNDAYLAALRDKFVKEDKGKEDL